MKESNIPAPKAAAAKKKLSYLDAREYETIEHRVTEAEVALEAQHDAVQNAASKGGKELEAAMAELEKRQEAVDDLYRPLGRTRKRKSAPCSAGWQLAADCQSALRAFRVASTNASHRPHCG